MGISGRRGWTILGLVAVLGVGVALAVAGGRGSQPEMQAHLADEPVVFRRLAMESAREGWAIDHEQRILRTEEGPGRWQEAGPGDPNRPDDVRIAAAFLDTRRSWAAVGDGPGSPRRFQVHRTDDGGRTWARVGEIELDESLAGESLGGLQLTFVDASHGWFLGQIHPGMHQVKPFLFATDDGGESWRLVMTTLPSPEGKLPEHPLKGSYSVPYGSEVITFVSEDRGFAGTGELFATTNGGVDWLPVELPAPPDPPELAEPFTYVRPPRFTSEEDGYVVVDVYAWEDVYCPPCDRFAAPPAATYLYRTRDAGERWSARKLPLGGGVVALSDSRHGWLLGTHGEAGEEGAQTVLYRTEDGGETWQQVGRELPVPSDANLIRLDERTGLAWDPEPPREGEPALYVTRDGGREWEPVEARLAASR